MEGSLIVLLSRAGSPGFPAVFLVTTACRDLNLNSIRNLSSVMIRIKSSRLIVIHESTVLRISKS